MWSWNDNFSSKEQGKVALIQLGDRNNIVLFQIERGASTCLLTCEPFVLNAPLVDAAGADMDSFTLSDIPECILNVIEDPAIIKLGVQIRGKDIVTIQCVSHLRFV